MAESGTTSTGLRYSTPVHTALALCYVLSTRNLDEEGKLEFDGWHNATAEELAEWEQEKKDRRIRMIHEMGEVG